MIKKWKIQYIGLDFSTKVNLTKKLKLEIIEYNKVH